MLLLVENVVYKDVLRKVLFDELGPQIVPPKAHVRKEHQLLLQKLEFPFIHFRNHDLVVFYDDLPIVGLVCVPVF